MTFAVKVIVSPYFTLTSFKPSENPAIGSKFARKHIRFRILNQQTLKHPPDTVTLACEFTLPASFDTSHLYMAVSSFVDDEKLKLMTPSGVALVFIRLLAAIGRSFLYLYDVYQLKRKVT